MKYVALFLALLTGCSATLADKARQGVTTAVSVLTATGDSLQQYDARKQQEIVDKARKDLDIDAARAALDAWRLKRMQIVKAMQGVWDSVVVLATGIPLYERGLKKDADVQGWIADVFKSLSALKVLLVDVGVPLGPLGAL